MSKRAFSAALLAILSIAAPHCFADSTPPLPRYDLSLGRQITYTSTSQSAGKDNFSNSTSTIDLTVLRKNDDGSLRLLMHTKSKSTSRYSKTQPPRTSEDDDYKFVNVAADGHALADKAGAAAPYAIYFPPLPADSAATAAGWQSVDEARQQTISCRLISDSPSDFTFSSTQDGLLHHIYQIDRDCTYHFDRSKGLISSLEMKYSQGYGFQSNGTGEFTLKSVGSIEPAALAQMDADFDLLLGDHHYYDALSDAKSATDIDTAIEKVKNTLQSAVDSVKTDEVKKQFADRIKSLSDESSYYKSDLENRQKYLDKPSPQWSATDIDGHPVSLEQFKGKVVVMDFWYRGCGWCMYATPAIKQLSQDYKDKPVVILGMNTDSEEADARFVMKEFSLPYTIVKAKGINDKYDIHGFPTMVIVDQSGVVRDFHVGYSTTLRTDVAKKIDELLAVK